VRKSFFDSFIKNTVKKTCAVLNRFWIRTQVNFFDRDFFENVNKCTIKDFKSKCRCVIENVNFTFTYYSIALWGWKQVHVKLQVGLNAFRHLPLLSIRT